MPFNAMIADSGTAIDTVTPLNNFFNMRRQQAADKSAMEDRRQKNIVNQMTIDKGQRDQADQAAYRNMLADPNFNASAPGMAAKIVGMGGAADLPALTAPAKAAQELAQKNFIANAPRNAPGPAYQAYLESGLNDPIMGPILSAGVGGADGARQALAQQISTPEGLEAVRRLAAGQTQQDVAELEKTTAMTNYYDARAAAAARPDAADAVKPPSGYAFNPDGSLRFIPGGPEDPANRPPAAPPSGYVPNPNKPGELLFVPGGPGDPAVIEAGQVARTPLKSLPSSVAKAIQTNKQNLRVVDQALTLLSGEDVGKLQGDKEALGVKTLLPPLLQSRLDPKGVPTRAAIGDLESMIVHERSGAAVPASEQPRLKPFLPIKGEKAEETIKKLERFRQIYEEIQSDYEEMYSEATGYNYKHGGGGTPPPAEGKPASGGARPPLSSFNR